MIKLSKSKFQIIPEGTHALKITEVDYDEVFGVMKITMENQDKIKVFKTFMLIDSNGEVNEKVMNVFSYFSRTALNNFSLDEIDEQELVGHFIKCEITHSVVPKKNDPSQTTTFVNIGKFFPALGFDGKDDLDDL